MHINFAMWRKASWQLIKMDDKKEWDALDVVSKWLIATRSAVTLVTVYSCVIAGILAARDGHFDWLTFIVLTLGLFIAHGTNNILNDYTDFTRGVDKDNYFRAQYGVHPLVQKFWDTSHLHPLVHCQRHFGNPGWRFRALPHGLLSDHHLSFCLWRGGPACLHLSLQILGHR
jgi:hypothetical protein